MYNDKARLKLSVKGKSTKLNDILKLYSTITYIEHDDKEKIEEDIVFNFKNLIECLYHSEDIVEQDLTENFDNEKEEPVVTKNRDLLERSYRLRILFRFEQDPDIQLII